MFTTVSIRYVSIKQPVEPWLGRIAEAGIALARIDERTARSPVGARWIERSHFADACASLSIDGELVHRHCHGNFDGVSRVAVG